MKFKDLTGQTFGFLTVLERAEDHISSSGKRRIKWKCRCERDGNITFVLGTNLQQGNIVSCGCYKKDVTDFKKQYNQYDLTGEFGIGYTSNTDSYGRNEFYFDIEDYDKIKDYCWYFNDQDYVLTHDKNKTIRLHRLIMNVEDDYEIDHILGKENRNNNRKRNLRVVTHAQNNWNKDKMITNTSGYRGVTFDKAHNKWAAQIDHNGEHKHLGLFKNIEDAYRARLEAEEKYYGEYSYDNSIKYYNEIA